MATSIEAQVHTTHAGLSTFEHVCLILIVVLLMYVCVMLRRIYYSANQHTKAWNEMLKRTPRP